MAQHRLRILSLPRKQAEEAKKMSMHLEESGFRDKHGDKDPKHEARSLTEGPFERLWVRGNKGVELELPESALAAVRMPGQVYRKFVFSFQSALQLAAGNPSLPSSITMHKSVVANGGHVESPQVVRTDGTLRGWVQVLLGNPAVAGRRKHAIEAPDGNTIEYEPDYYRHYYRVLLIFESNEECWLFVGYYPPAHKRRQ
jgi:hypothetical protein